MTEQKKNRPFELRSEEIEDILGRSPSGIIRWGITILTLILIALLVGSWFFQYPDIITAPVEVTAENPPAYIAARASGKLEELAVTDKQLVDSGYIVAIIENPARYKDVFTLKRILDSISPFVESYDLMYWDSSVFVKDLILGQIQPFFSDFLVSLQDYVHYVRLDYYNQKIKSIREEVFMYNELVKRLTEQQRILDQDRELKKKDFNRYQQLFDGGVITEADLERTKSEYLQKELAYEESREELANAKIQIARLQQDILDLGLQDVQQSKRLELRMGETYENLLAQIEIWEQQYTLKSPLKGMVTLTQYWVENQNVNLGDKVMAIVPAEESQTIGKLRLRPRGAGKVKIGQDVNIKFQNYPYMEFGMVKGKVSKISLVPSDDESYLVEVIFPNGLTTNYGINLEFSQKMIGQAEIITEELPLLIRIIMPVRSLIRNKSFRAIPESP